MKGLWHQLDRLLRGRETVLNEQSLAATRLYQLLLVPIILGAAYGFFMGWYAIFSRPEPEYRQVLACIVKVPALFILTLFICFPSLYVFSTMLGSRLGFSATLKVLLAVVAITVTVLASFGPIVAFFAVSTDNYDFMKLLNVAFFAIAGFLGVGSLLKALQVLLRDGAIDSSSTPPLIIGTETIRESEARVRRVFRIWIMIYALVGAQMGWVLRPFLGAPGMPFSWFRDRHANFFVDVWNTIMKFFS